MTTLFDVIIKLALFSALAVDGSKIEATDGQTATICFDIDEVEKADLVKIIFKGEDERKRVIAQRPWPFDDPTPAGVSMKVGKGRVSMTIQKVDNSSSGLYEARVFFGEKWSSVEVQLIVNKAALSTIAPPQTSTPKPVTSDLRWLLALIPLVIVILGVVCFLKCRKVWCFQDQEPVAVIVMDCCKENELILRVYVFLKLSMAFPTVQN